MRPGCFFAFLFFSLTATIAVSQENISNSRFATMSVAEAQELSGESLSRDETDEFIRGVLDSKRIELIKVAWAKFGSRVGDEVAKLPDSPFKEDVLLMMLKTDSYHWPDTILYGSRGTLGTTEPFTALIRKYFPRAEPTLSLIKTREARLQLVAEIEGARGAANRSEPLEEQPSTIPSKEKANPTNQKPSSGAATPASAVNALVTKERQRSSIWLWICAAIAALIAAAVLLTIRLRRQKTGSP
jgi:hypothetical protein